jgi:preprotein translocase subunit YajC
LLVFISNAFAETAPTAAADANPMASIIGMWPLLLFAVGIYFLVMRPQMRRQKEHRAMIDALAKGDEVVTSGGLMGKVVSLAENAIGMQVADGVEVQMQRSAVVQVLPKGTIK